MSKIIAIVGESGSGKSASMRNLKPESTVIISPIQKDLPFKQTGYSEKAKNLFHNLRGGHVLAYLQSISEKAPHVNVVVIDDFQYIMGTAFMDRAKEKGYEKFTEIGKTAYDLIVGAQNLRDDLNVYFLAHEDQADNGRRKIKTIGRMLDDKITLEGLFTTVLFTKIENGGYSFVTQSDGMTTAKSPMGMFELEIDNDLAQVDNIIRKYYE
jgi:hypothetical protein